MKQYIYLIQFYARTGYTYIKLSWKFTKAFVKWGRSGFKKSKLADKRLAICKECPHYIEKKCTVCGCHIPLKTKWISEECPIEKW